MSRYNRCNDCYNMKCVFVTGEREDIDTSECADFRPMTNADRIRQMNGEELAIVCEDGCPPGDWDCDCVPLNRDEPVKEHCVRCWREWLKAPVEEVNEETE